MENPIFFLPVTPYPTRSSLGVVGPEGGGSPATAVSVYSGDRGSSFRRPPSRSYLRESRTPFRVAWHYALARDARANSTVGSGSGFNGAYITKYEKRTRLFAYLFMYSVRGGHKKIPVNKCARQSPRTIVRNIRIRVSSTFSVYTPSIKREISQNVRPSLKSPPSVDANRRRRSVSWHG